MIINMINNINNIINNLLRILIFYCDDQWIVTDNKNIIISGYYIDLNFERNLLYRNVRAIEIPNYLAPEKLAYNRRYDHHLADVYSFALILWELCSFYFLSYYYNDYYYYYYNEYSITWSL